MADENTFDPSLLDNEAHRSAAIEKLSGSGYVVKSRDDYNSSMNDFLKGLSHEDERVNHILAPVVRREREPLETWVKEITGIDKIHVDDKPEKALPYAQRAIKAKIDELTEKAKKGVTNEQLIKDFDDYKGSTAQKIKLLEKQLKEKDASLLQKDVIFDINTSIAKREGKFSSDERIKPLIKTQVEMAKRQALEMNPEYRQVGENKVLVFIDENGSVKYHNDGNPYTVDKFIDEQLAPILEQDHQQQGAGTGADQDQGKHGFAIPSTIKTVTELDDYITETLNLSLSDKEVLKKRNEIKESRKLKLY